ncbi:hypothetical protein [Lacinutrix jangbogonensis]|uniref:hypothetical protein n=1 Tax=Lacinutrix jangbogonensis TaxID=1469557 RepID=UPI00053EE72D|nr:hypothetical protein [Lacinutrix jangbogonensis]
MALSKKTKTRILFGFTTGLITSILVFFLDLFTNEPTQLYKYIFYFISTTIISATIVGYFAIKKDTKKE